MHCSWEDSASIIFTDSLGSLRWHAVFIKGTDSKTRFRFPRSLPDLRENVSGRINLGLDLRGGMHLILQVQVDEAINSETDQVVERLRSLLREQAIGYQAGPKPDATHVQVTGIPAEQLEKAR